MSGAVRFNQRVKHGGLDFHPGVVYRFDDPDAGPYFKATGWADDTDDDPDVTISIDEIDIDPCTVWGGNRSNPNWGHFVMPDRAAAQRGTTIEEARAFVWSGESRETLNAKQGGATDG